MTVPVGIVDTGLSNLDSIVRALEVCGGAPTTVRTLADLAGAGRVVLPGVGAFPDGMAALRERGLDTALRQHAAAGRPLLGVCLGMQLLASSSAEGGTTTPGLGLVPGEVVRLDPDADERIPHIGWNEVHRRTSSPLFEGIDDGADFYFVHSYHVRADSDAVVATTPYAGGFASAVRSGAVAGVQFHPEKSQRRGMQLLGNFLRWPC